MDLGLQFGPAGNVTAQTLGVPAPDCGPNAIPVLGPDGSWVCHEVHTHGSGAMLLLAGAAVWVLWNVYSQRGARVWKALKGGDLGAIL